MAKAKQYWLVKSEPDDYSIDDLQHDGQIAWTGVRNYQARNFMRDTMQVGDLALFYHSNANPSGIVGVARVASKPYADPTQFDAKSQYFDAKATADEPRWQLVDFAFVEKFSRTIPLAELKEEARLEGMLVTRRGQRLSVQPVEKAHFERVLKLV